MRGLSAFFAAIAALVVTTSAAADLQPPRPQYSEIGQPAVRVGAIQIPSGQASGRVRVIATLPLAPLAASGDRYYAVGARSRLDVRSSSSRAYLARVETAQRLAMAELGRAIPSASVSSRFNTVLNAMTIELPARRIPALMRLSFVKRVYPSLSYTRALDRSPSVIGAAELTAATGARGDGIKIAVVDDGVDQKSRFFRPAGFRYPAGFPKGNRAYTTPKVIVARSFPAPSAGRRARMPLDRRSSFHGTHVAGIAAGDAPTTAPRGADHPRVVGLSGAAPRAFIGNYRVFSLPTPIGEIANTPEIVAAFEAAVRDGMDVINFSGGGPETDPVNDALIETVRNVSAAGVVPVISAGNDRDDFGLGSAGAPGTAPDAISVAAVSNTHVFSPALRVVAPGAPIAVRRIPVKNAGQGGPPRRWGAQDQALVDVAALRGRNTRPVNARLCSTGRDPNSARSPLRPGSLRGAIVLVSRGTCTFFSKAFRARRAGAVGLVVIDNRPGEANRIPVELPLPAVMISDFDGAQLRLALAASGGRTRIRVSRGPERIETGRSGIVTSFSSAGPTSYEHQLKPDVSAPGGEILSATLGSAGGPFAVFDGTSMAAPHVAGAAALLLQRHPEWTPRQVKSALVSTAGPAWADTARTVEAPVTLQGGGLVNVPAAHDPKIFSDPVSLSFGDLNVNRGGRSRSLLTTVTDGGDGGGTWTVEVRPQAATPGSSLVVPPTVTLAPFGTMALPVIATAAADALAGDNYGFIVLRRDAIVRRIPYLFLVTRPGLERARVLPLRKLQAGTTRGGRSRATAYRFPAAPFRPSPNYTGPAVQETGAEKLYSFNINEPVLNFGVSVVGASPRSLIDPWLLESPDENDVAGYAGTPVNVNSFTSNYQFNVGAAGAVFPRPKRYYVSVDSGRDPFTRRSFAGRYILNSWVNDVTPPRVELLTRRVSTGRPVLAARVLDPESGVDPTSLVFSYRRTLVEPSLYDATTGLVLFGLPREAPILRPGRTETMVVAADFQESKNVTTPGGTVLPNTTFRETRLRIVNAPALSWLLPGSTACVERNERLLVAASAPGAIARVLFFDGERRIGADRRGAAGLYALTWRTRGAAKGRHTLRAVVLTRGGRQAIATRVVRVCR